MADTIAPVIKNGFHKCFIPLKNERGIATFSCHEKPLVVWKTPAKPTKAINTEAIIEGNKIVRYLKYRVLTQSKKLSDTFGNPMPILLIKLLSAITLADNREGKTNRENIRGNPKIATYSRLSLKKLLKLPESVLKK
jgi:hypothetical protein